MTEPMNPDYKPGNPEFESERALIWGFTPNSPVNEALQRQARYWMHQVETGAAGDKRTRQAVLDAAKSDWVKMARDHDSVAIAYSDGGMVHSRVVSSSSFDRAEAFYIHKTLYPIWAIVGQREKDALPTVVTSWGSDKP